MNEPFLKSNRYFHTDDKFDFEKFYYSMLAFTNPIVFEASLYITTMFIYWDEEEGRPYGQYRIPQFQKTKRDFVDEASFLENYRLYLDDTDNKNFTIYKAYHNFKQLSLDKKEGRFHELLEPENMKNYFGLDTDHVPSLKDISFSKKTYTVNNFILAEQVLLKNLIHDFNPKESVYLILPIICQGHLAGMVYYIYDKSKLKGQLEAALKNYRRFLLLTATREFESNLLQSNYRVYHPKPNDPLRGYYPIFKDLKIPYPFKEELEITEKKIITGNPFLMDLGYDDYYRILLSQVLIKESQQLIDASKAHIKSAIISIIVDSFAHNIGAHSLVALKWYFEERFKAMGKKFLPKGGIQTKAVKLTGEQLKDLVNHPANDFHRTMNKHFGRKLDGQMSLLDIIRYMPDQLQNDLFNFYSNHEKLIAQMPIPLASSIYRFFEYLRDKSAFWSGVTRDTVFSGLVMSWMDLLRDFFTNTLFLGTITHSEGINKIHVHIEILNDQSNKIRVGGEFAIVDLGVIRNDKLRRGENSHSPYAFLKQGKHFTKVYKALNELDKVFLPNGIIGQHALYTILENTLRNIKHYKKHLRKTQQNGVIFCISIQKVGFTIREEHKQTEDTKLYKVGTWLHLPQQLVNEEEAFINEEKIPFYHKKAVIHGHTQQLRRRVVDRQGQAILGGSSQDKVCACMLMNNTFKSVDEMDKRYAKKHYFPYVFAASELYHNIKERYEDAFLMDDACLHKIYNSNLAHNKEHIRRAKYKEVTKAYINKVEKKKGIIKKYFHLWMGEKCKFVSSAFEQAAENLSRFQLIVVDKFEHEGEVVSFRYENLYTQAAFDELNESQKEEELKRRKENALYQLRNQGVIRIVEANDQLKNLKDKEEEQFVCAQLKWLGEWLSKNGEERLGLLLQKPREQDYEETDSFGAMVLEKNNGGWKATYYNKRALRKVDMTNMRHTSLKLDHAEKQIGESSRVCCLIRSHGTLMAEVFDGYSMDERAEGKNIGQAIVEDVRKQAKLLETCLTQISIFDNRLYERIQEALKGGDKDRFEEQMNLIVYNEKSSRNFFENRREILQKGGGHFMIIHLSYLETMYRTEKMKERYTENDVEKFFQEQIADFYKEEFGESLPGNFILVITSGRGRGDWFRAIQHPQITFRPIESLVNAVEDGLYIKDDFQIKSNLCNVIFGS